MKDILPICLLLLFFCTACTGQGMPEGSEPTPADSYTFPPDDAELALAMQSVGLDWQSADGGRILPDGQILIYYMDNPENNIACGLRFVSGADWQYSFVFSYDWPPLDERTFEPQFKAAYVRFHTDEWPLFWDLSGELLHLPEEVNTIAASCLAYFEAYTGEDQGSLLWWGRQDDLFCRVSFEWHRQYKHYLPTEINFFGPQALSAEMDYYIDRIGQNSPPQTISTLTEERGYVLVSGYIEQLQANDTDFDINRLGEGYPKNIDLYQQGWLVDTTGRVPVYLMPTPLSEAELAEERLHVVRYVHDPEPCYLIQYTAVNYALAE